MSYVIKPDNLRPHFNVMALCISRSSNQEVCLNKWVATVISGTCLFKLECPKCGAFNSFVSFLVGIEVVGDLQIVNIDEVKLKE